MIPIFYINLADAQRRRAAMEDQLVRLDLKAERIEAATPADIPASDRRRYCDPERYHWVQPAELACSLSHIRAWDALEKLGAAFGLILEDDAILSSRLPAFLAAWQEADYRPDLIRLETSLDRLRTEHRPEATLAGIGLHRMHASAGGSAAYVISARLARDLASRRELLVRPIDSVLFDRRRSSGTDPAFVHTIPGLALQADKQADALVESSVIKPAFALRTGTRPRSRLRRLLYAGRGWIDNEIRLGSAKVLLDLTGRTKLSIDFIP